MSNALGRSEQDAETAEQTFICSETGKTFSMSLSTGIAWPVDSSYSDKKTGYPAEFCYWTADGKVASSPTYVFVKAYAGSNEPTFCPDCGRLVKMRNPGAFDGLKPPPTQQEYKASKPSEEP